MKTWRCYYYFVASPSSPFFLFFHEKHMVFNILHTSNNKNGKSSFTFLFPRKKKKLSIDGCLLIACQRKNKHAEQKRQPILSVLTFKRCQSQIFYENVLDDENRLCVCVCGRILIFRSIFLFHWKTSLFLIKNHCILKQ